MIRHPGDIVFYKEDGSIIRKGTIGFYDPGFFNPAEGIGEPPSGEPIIGLQEFSALLDYLDRQFPSGWIIENGELKSYN